MAIITDPELINQIKNDMASEDVICETARKLLVMRDPNAINPLLDRLYNINDPWWVKRELLLTLAGISISCGCQRAEVIDVLITMLNSKGESDRIREVAASSLGLLSATQASSDLLSVLQYAIKNKNPSLIYSCAESLSKLKDPRVIKIFIQILDSDLPLVKVFIAKALGRFGSAANDSLPSLRKLADYGSPAEKKFAIESIQIIEGEIEN